MESRSLMLRSVAGAIAVLSLTVTLFVHSAPARGQASSRDDTGTAQRAALPDAQSGSVGLEARGKYVALAADCSSCHTAAGGKPFAGGYPLKSAFGIIYGTNITSDAKTGIGDWTKADFERAIRHGVRKDGEYLYPAMPYGSYTKMTDSDVDALWAYIHSLPAVNNEIPKNTLPFPFSVRKGMALWQGLYFKPGVFVAVGDKSAEWNRGAYLVQALAHCDECHTPRNLAQGLETRRELTGAQIEGWYAPDIGSDPSSKVHQWSDQQFVTFLKSGVMPNNSKVVGPMQEVVRDSLRYLTPTDLHAMVTYLKNQETNAKPQPASPVKFARLAEGKLVYENNCSSCHQSDGTGQKTSIPALAHNDAVIAREPFNVMMAILEGFAPQGTWGAMGSFAGTLSDDQIADVTNYVRTAWGNGGIPNATPWLVSSWRKDAQSPKNESHALLCPNLNSSVMKPALALGPADLKQAAGDAHKMSQLIGSYRSKAPKASRADVVEALSTAYCRAIAQDRISEALMSAQLADFAQRVATSLRSHAPAS
jgi:mono/diheme cytochrome c family protein